MLLAPTPVGELATVGATAGAAAGAPMGQDMAEMMKTLQAVIKSAMDGVKGQGGGPSKRRRNNQQAPVAAQGAYERLQGGNPANPVMCARNGCSAGSRCSFNHANKRAAAAARAAPGNAPAQAQ